MYTGKTGVIYPYIHVCTRDATVGDMSVPEQNRGARLEDMSVLEQNRSARLEDMSVPEQNRGDLSVPASGCVWNWAER
jgi:hypothetical protein